MPQSAGDHVPQHAKDDALPESAEDGLAKAGEKAADEAKAVALPLGGDPENAPAEEEPAE